MPVVSLRPDRFAAGGEAIAREDSGRIVFVRGALPGEAVTAELTTEKRDWARGHLVDVLEPSPHRVLGAIRELGASAWTIRRRQPAST